MEKEIVKNELKELKQEKRNLLFEIFNVYKKGCSLIKVYYKDIKSKKIIFEIGYIRSLNHSMVAITNDRKGQVIIINLNDIERVLEIERNEH